MSSSESDTEETKRLRSALDPAFTLHPKLTSTPALESKRNKVKTEWDPGHYQTIKVEEKGREFLSKRLTAALDKKIKFVDSQASKSGDEARKMLENLDAEEGIYLFTNSVKPFSTQDLLGCDTIMSNHNTSKTSKKKKPSLRKRKIEDDVESEDEDTKLKSVAVSFDWVLNQKY